MCLVLHLNLSVLPPFYRATSSSSGLLQSLQPSPQTRVRVRSSDVRFSMCRVACPAFWQPLPWTHQYLQSPLSSLDTRTCFLQIIPCYLMVCRLLSRESLTSTLISPCGARHAGTHSGGFESHFLPEMSSSIPLQANCPCNFSFLSLFIFFLRLRPLLIMYFRFIENRCFSRQFANPQ